MRKFPAPISFKHFVILMASMAFICAACNNKSNSGKEEDREIGITSVKLEYAKGFRIQALNGAKRITVYNPWQGATNIAYQYFISNSKPSSSELKKEIWIKNPVHRIICLSTTQIAMIAFLDELQSIIGISGAQYICNPDLQKRISEKKVMDVGYDLSLNYELIYSLKPDLVLIYGVNSEASSVYDRLNSLGIPAMFIGEYLEPEPLAKAEWVKLIACLYDKDSLAGEKYGRMATEYEALKKMTLSLGFHPVVMTGLPWKEAWNIPGGDSFTARIIADAGGKYLWAERKTRENIPMNLEQAVNDAKNADIWINAGIARSVSDISATDERLASLNPILTGRVFNNNKIICPRGGNAYWESGVVQPQLILQDLIMIFHPELNLNKELTYYKKLE